MKTNRKRKGERRSIKGERKSKKERKKERVKKNKDFFSDKIWGYLGQTRNSDKNKIKNKKSKEF